MIVLRAVLYQLCFILITIPVGSVLALFAWILPTAWVFALIRFWRVLVLACERQILGIRTEVLGRDNIPAQAAVVFAKHQSAWETISLQELFRPAVFVLKRELLKIPFFGWGLAAMKVIAIDRAAGKDALQQVLEQGKDRLARGFWVIIFPEGTRLAPGQKKRFKPGGAYLAVHAGARVVPVAHNAGELWPKNAFLKRPGTITVSIGPAIDPAGLSEHEVNARAEAWIEAEMRRLSPHRYPAATPARE